MSQKVSRLTIFILLTMVLVFLVPVSAQDTMAGPAVEVADQVVVDSSVTVDYVYSDGPGFIVIHIDNEGRPGPVIGYRQLSPGANHNVTVWIDGERATPVLYAMLHVDTGEVGVYEFGTVEGADGPAMVDGAPVTPPFNVAVLNVHNQFLENDTFTAASVTVAEGGWLAIHVDTEGRPGPVAGYAAVDAGTTTNVAVELDASMVTPVLWPMLHVDTGEVGVYEFGSVEGVDGPVRLGGAVAVTSVWTEPHMRVDNQIVTSGDGMEAMLPPTLTARAILAEEPGWLAVHIDNEGRPGPVAGYAAVEPGLNTNVVVELDASMVTPVLWPMLHVDTGEVGVYEFGSVEGVDGPVRVNDQVVVFSIFAAPAIVYDVTAESESSIVVAGALIDAPGWLAIHVDNEGRPGPVAGYAPLTPGWNSNIVVEVNADMMTATVFPMLHYDTGELGVYEFGTVEGADGPVRVGGNVVVGPAEVIDG